MPDLDPQLREYIVEMMKEAGTYDVPTVLREKMIRDIYSRLEEKLVLTALENMSLEKRAEFDELTEKGATQEELEKFIRNNVKNFEQVYKKALLEFRSIYIEAARMR